MSQFVPPILAAPPVPPAPLHHAPSRPALTLADVRAGILASSSLAPARRREIASALLTIAKVLRTELHLIEADTAELRRRVYNALPARSGVSPRRWRNVTSLLRAALLHSEVSTIPARSDAALMPDWRELIGHVTSVRVHKSLSRFARYCSGAGIKPGVIDQATFDGFHQALTTSCLVRSPDEVAQGIAAAWNMARATVPCWPPMALLAPSKLKNPSLPWSAYPPSLERDVDVYFQARCKVNLLSRTRARPLRTVTVNSRKGQLRALANAEVLAGVAGPDDLANLAELLRPDRLDAGFTLLLARSGGKATLHLHQIAYLARMIARDHLGAGPEELEQLTALCCNLKPKGTSGMTAKNRALLRQFDAPRAVDALLHLPPQMFAEACKAKDPTKAEALVAQTAVAIEILLMAPIRIKNLAQLRMEDTLVFNSDDTAHIVISADDMKTDADLEMPLPAESVRMIRTYLARFHPLLTGNGADWLFPGLPGRHKALATVSRQIVRALRVRAGLKVNVHAFRHIAAKLYLETNPGGYGVIKLLLGHRSIETTMNYYCGTEGAAAVRHYDQMILAKRGSLPGLGRGPTSAYGSLPDAGWVGRGRSLHGHTAARELNGPGGCR